MCTLARAPPFLYKWVYSSSPRNPFPFTHLLGATLSLFSWKVAPTLGHHYQSPQGEGVPWRGAHLLSSEQWQDAGHVTDGSHPLQGTCVVAQLISSGRKSSEFAWAISCLNHNWFSAPKYLCDLFSLIRNPLHSSLGHISRLHPHAGFTRAQTIGVMFRLPHQVLLGLREVQQLTD